MAIADYIVLSFVVMYGLFIGFCLLTFVGLLFGYVLDFLSSIKSKGD